MLAKAKRKAHMLSKYKNSRVTTGMRVCIWIKNFDLSCFSAISILSTWIYWVECSVTVPCALSWFTVRWPHFSVAAEIPGIVGEIMAGEILAMLCDPVTSSYIGGKNLSLIKSKEKFWFISEGSKQQMTSVFALAKHTLSEQLWRWLGYAELYLCLSICSVFT